MDSRVPYSDLVMAEIVFSWRIVLSSVITELFFIFTGETFERVCWVVSTMEVEEISAEKPIGARNAGTYFIILSSQPFVGGCSDSCFSSELSFLFSTKGDENAVSCSSSSLIITLVDTLELNNFFFGILNILERVCGRCVINCNCSML